MLNIRKAPVGGAVTKPRIKFRQPSTGTMNGVEHEAANMTKAPALFRDPEFSAYLTERGITEASARACKLRSLDPKAHADAMAQPGLLWAKVSGGLFPFFDLDGAEIEFARTRLFGPPYCPSKSKKAAKFLQRGGAVSHLYMPPMLSAGRTWRQVAGDVSVPVLITEGEVKAIAACQRGYACLAITGVFNFLQKVEADEDAEDQEQESQLIADFALFDWNRRTVNIIFDSDAALNPNVRKAEQRLMRALYDKGARPFVVRLPGIKGVGKSGLDDYLMKFSMPHHARKALNKLIAEATSPLVPRVMKVTDLAAQTFPPTTYIINGLLPTGLSILVSLPKIGKSFFVLQAGHAIAARTMVFGSHTVTPGEVLYIALEDRPERIRSRLERMDLKPVDGLNIANKWPRGDAAYEALARYLDDNPKTKLIAIDTLQKFRRPAGGNKNETSYEADYAELGMLKTLADTYNVGILLVHHQKKGKVADVFEGVLGSTAITGAMDTILVLERKRHSARGVMHTTSRDIEEQRLTVEFDMDDTCTWRVLGQVVEVATELMTSEVQQIFVDVLHDAGAPMSLMDIAEAVTAARDGKVCSRPNARQTLLRLIEQERVQQDAQKHYFLTRSTTPN